MREYMPPLPAVSGPLGGPQPDLEYESDRLVRFEPDHPEGPVVGFVYNEVEDVRLVVLEHHFFYHEEFISGTGKPLPLALTGEDQRLVYTPMEWVAFYLGVGLGEYDEACDEAPEVPIRDSKFRKGHYFIFDNELFCSWIDGIKSGKYMLPAGQHAVISSWLDMKLRHSQNTGAIEL